MSNLNQSIERKEQEQLARAASANFTERNRSVYKVVKVAVVATHIITAALSVASLTRFLQADFKNYYLTLAVISGILIVLEMLQNAGLNAYFRNTLNPTTDTTDDYSNSLVAVAKYLAIGVTAVNILLPTASGYFASTGEKISIATKLQRIKAESSPTPTLNLAEVKSKYKGLAASNQAAAQKAAAEKDAAIVAAVTAETVAEEQANDFYKKIAAFSLLFIALIMEIAKWGGTKLMWTYVFRAAAENKRTPPLSNEEGQTTKKEAAHEATQPHQPTERNPIGFNRYKPVATKPTAEEELNIRLRYEQGKNEAGIDLAEVLETSKKFWQLQLANWKNKLNRGIGKEVTNEEHIKQCELKIQEINLQLNKLKATENGK